MHITEIMRGHSPTFSFEFFPPKTPQAAETLYQTIRDLESYMPDFVSVTYGAGGSTRELTHDLVERIQHTTKLDPIPHLTCVCHNEEKSKRFCSDTQSQSLETFSRSAAIDRLEWLTINRATRSNTRSTW
jgi:5,10-methylenetetrahydrofolate reductase